MPAAAQPAADPKVFAENMAKVAEQCQRVWREYLGAQSIDTSLPGADPLNISGAFTELFTRMLRDPKKLAEMQFALWQDTLDLWKNAGEKLLGEPSAPVIAADPRDKRFKDPAWQDNALFDFLKQSYLLTARTLHRAVHEVEGMDPAAARKVDFYTRQFIDALSPSNFAMTNPEVLRATVESNGENLVKGLSNLLKDVTRGGGKLKISMADERQFEVGKNLAVTPGKVIFRNDLMELIQYAPTTAQVHQAPLLVIPPWINKYYILDMQPENSCVRWATGQGYTVFVVSWVNPDERLAGKTFDDYLEEGALAALEAIEKATGEPQVAAIGYCLGGTLLACLLAYLHAKKQSKRVVSATYFTTMVDFTEAGELGIFIDEEQLKLLETKMAQKGYLEGSDMATTFNMLRANDLIWSFVVNNYLLGKEPFPFDLLYWNADSTRMPAKMHSFYLRNMYQKNLLSQGKLSLLGVKMDLTKITTPSYMLSCKEDHIAPWKSTYAATQLYAGKVRFVLAASGHIAGVVNPPSKNKYNYWVGEKLPKSPDAWFASAKEIPGSWWPDWDAWQKKLVGKKVSARIPGKGKLKALGDAPGAYVKVKA